MTNDHKSGVPIERPAIELKPYREETFAGYALGIVVGIVLTISMTYAGLRLGFTVPASAMAAMIGLGVLRSMMKKGSIVENNINQTVAAAINITCSGIIFTVPILYLRGDAPDLISITLAAVAGSFLGTVFIIPLRKQMVDLERLRFPTGYATAMILKAAGGGERAKLLFYGMIGGVAWYVGTHLDSLQWILQGLPAKTGPDGKEAWKATWPILLNLDFHKHVWSGIPEYINPVIEFLMTSIAAGFIAGRPALVVVWGGLLANWVVAPICVNSGWITENIARSGLTGKKLAAANADHADFMFRWISRPLGIGMLVGGAIMGIVMAWPMIKAAFQSLARGGAKGSSSQELSPKLMYSASAIAVLMVTAAGVASGLDVKTAMAAGIVASVWMWLAGVIVAQTTGVTDWSPISGMALISIVLMMMICRLFGVDEKVAIIASVTMAVGVAVAMSQAADMMQDLKTGHLVGAIPKRQQKAQLWVAWIGPIVSVVTLYALYQAAAGKLTGIEGGNAFGAKYAAPQANALSGTISVLTGDGGAETFIRYGIGAVIGGLLSLAAGGGMGVQVGLSMYLPFSTIAAFGIGCLLSMWVEKRFGTSKLEAIAIPIAAGLLVGDSLAGVVDSTLALF
ncbi:MAG: OPT/YSL family transporter [Planctomycetes bacterium]|nr:OPT/YSL family transporter [Planctomycetota bacterium]